MSANPVFNTSSGDFKEKYSAKLRKIVKNCQKATQGKISLGAMFMKGIGKDIKISGHTEMWVNVSIDHNVSVLIDGKPFKFIEFAYELAQIPNHKLLDLQPSVAALNTILQSAIQLIANGAVIPQIFQLQKEKYAVRWLPATLSSDVREIIANLENILPPDTFRWEDVTDNFNIDKNPAQNLLSLFLTEIINIVDDNVSDDLYLNMFFNKKENGFIRPGEESLAGGIKTWTQKYYISQGKYTPQLVIEEVREEDFKLIVKIKGLTKDVNETVDLIKILSDKKYALERYDILQSITQLSSFIDGLDHFINTNGVNPIVMKNEIFTQFLIELIPAIQLLDIETLLPKSLQHILKPKASLKIKQKAQEGKSYIRLDDMLNFDWQVAIGDTVMDEEEFKKLLTKSDGLIKYKTNYIYVNHDEINKIYKHFSNTKEMSPMDMLRTALSGEYMGAAIAITEDVKKMIDELTNFKEIPLPMHLNATLRPYQHRGYSWMYRNAKIGFGSVIADDMGLGKTLQVITTLQKYKEEGQLDTEKVLVVAPTGLLTNWQKEIERFAPTLKAIIYHGTGRKLADDLTYDIVITSYGVIRSEAKDLKKKKWHSMVIDEAQNIKNINTEQTKAIKTIGAKNFIAMSGTPVENRLSELWSILDYSNRGFLGNLKEFNETYGNPIQINNDESVAAKLKKVTSPFMMRRLKSDKSIISDLLDKIEMDSYASLVKEQASLYQKTLEKALEEIDGISGTDHKSLFARQGLVLQMILCLKQICNHPTQFLKNNIIDDSLSGKMELLYDKLYAIIESNEKVLIFTQFTEMGKLLQTFITNKYGEQPLFYHGGCTVKQRNEMVENFQTNRADKIFILSLKAAGTGLNLTAASHVIHYDLWWNPAVEAQATDRAYRIGQKSNVMVHRFITKGTFEEKINDMIQAKKALANMTVATGENWIGNLSNKELKDLFVMGIG